MPGGLIQLVAVGVQDEKLTRDPEITFFKSVYDPYVNFAMESIENTFQGVCDFGRKVQVDIQRNGDLVTKMTLEVDVPELVDVTGTGVAGVSWAPNLGHTLVRQVCVNIGGTDIDRHYGIWWDAWTELTLPTGKRVGYNLMIGQQNVQPVVGLPNGGPGSPTPQITAVTLRTVGNQTCKNSIAPLDPTVKLGHAAQRLYIPLRFWFNENWGLALPLIALQFHQVRVQYEFRSFTECVVLCPCDANAGDVAPSIGPGGPGTISPLNLDNCVLWVDYIYLDNDARQHYAQNPHEYLIKQLQYNQGDGVTTFTPRVRLNFNHPTSELVLWFQEDDAVNRGTSPNCPGGAIYGGNQWNFYAVFDAATGPLLDPSEFGTNPVADMKLQMNGQDRFAARTGDYFNLVQPYYHHSNVPVLSPDGLDTRSRGLLVYSFALDPEEQQPQGTANFSRIDTSQIVATLRNIGAGNDGRCHCFAVNYNFFRVAGGMGGLAFAA